MTDYELVVVQARDARHLLLRMGRTQGQDGGAMKSGNGICRECQRPYGKHYAGCSLERVSVEALLDKARTPHPTDVFTIYSDEKFDDEDSYAVLVTFDSQADRDTLVYLLGGPCLDAESEPGVPSGRGYE